MRYTDHRRTQAESREALIVGAISLLLALAVAAMFAYAALRVIDGAGKLPL